MRRWILVVCGCAFVGLQPVRAQVTTGAPRAAAAAPSPARLPVRRVVLYKNGVGYFEHLGRVRGTQTLSIAFNTSQLNDVLKSLTIVDLGNGRIADVSFNSDAPLARRLDAFALPLGDKPTLVDLLGALRGTRLELRAPGRVIVGRLLGVERRRSKDDVPKDEVTLVSDAGELRSIELTPAVTVKLAERASVDQVSGYLGLLASTRGQDRRTMTISAVGDGSRDVMVGYVSEVPVWKTTYRIVLPAKAGASAILQGWAIVDNTIGEDWNDVELSLVAGAPQSFVQPLSQPVYTQRPVVGVSRAATPAPQVHGETAAAHGVSLSGRVVDRTGAAVPGAAVTASATTGRRFTAITDAQGRYAFPIMPAGNYRVEFALAGFQNVTIERIYLDSTPRQLQDTVLAIASISETVTVTSASPRISDPMSSRLVGPRGGGAVGASAAAAPTVDRAAVEERVAEMQATARGEAVGDLFEYRAAGPITIRMNQSALVPILASNVALERVSLWNDRIGGARPLRSVWLTNTSGMTLDGGSFTVLDAATFVGEGLVEPMKPGEKRLLSYAVDLGVQVDSRNGDDSQRVSRIQIARGVASVRNEQRSRKVYSVCNNDAAARTVVIEHPIRAGWTLVSPAPVESSLTSYRFAVSVGPNASATLVVDERRPISTEIAIADLTDQQMALYVADNGETLRLKEALGPIQSKKAQIASLTASYEARQEEAQHLNDDQQRLRENMRALKGSAGERRLLKRYVGQLDEEEDRIAVLQRECGEIDSRIGAARDELAAMIERLSLELDMDDAARQ